MGEGNDPKVTVAIGGGIYRSTGRLMLVLPYRTRSERTYAALFVDGAWMYTDPGDDDRAWGLINEPVTVIWKLAYGRRYIRHSGRTGADEASQSSGGAGGHGSRATWIPAPQVYSPCHRDRSLIQGMNAERWLDVLADFPTVDEKAESISGTVSLGVDPGTTDDWAWRINKCRDGDRRPATALRSPVQNLLATCMCGSLPP